MTTETLLDVRGLSVRFTMPRKSLFAALPVLQAVRDISFSLRSHCTPALVGEVARARRRRRWPRSGWLRRKPARSCSTASICSCRRRGDAPRRRHLQITFQDPNSSLNLRERVGAIVREPSTS